MENPQPTKKTIEWDTLEYAHVRHSVDWYWSVGFVAVLLVVLSIFFGNILFAVLVIAGIAALIIHAVRKPKMIHVRAAPSGIQIDNEKYPYIALHSFWIDTVVKDEPKLILQSKKTLSPYLVIPVEKDVDEDDLRDYLLRHLPEEEHHEPLPQKIMEYLGF